MQDGMAEEVERSAASVEEALEAALQELGLTEQEAVVRIVQEPKSGFLGLKSQEAVVRVRARSAPASESELLPQAEAAVAFMEGLLELIDLDTEVEYLFEDGTMYVDVWGAEDDDGMGLLIGKHAATLDALQEIVRSVVQRQVGERCRVIVDVEDYRKRRRAQLVSRAKDVAQRVKRTGREEELDPMNPYERKIVHDAVASLGGLETESEGEEPDRRVVIKPHTG